MLPAAYSPTLGAAAIMASGISGFVSSPESDSVMLELWYAQPPANSAVATA